MLPTRLSFAANFYPRCRSRSAAVPQCLTVKLFEHQLQAVQWMYDQEALDGGVLQHVWAELPRPHAPAVRDFERKRRFRRFSHVQSAKDPPRGIRPSVTLMRLLEQYTRGGRAS